MFDFARTSATAAMVAAGAAGFAALGAGVAFAAGPSPLDPATGPVTDALGAAQAGYAPDVPELSVVLPAPDTRNLGSSAGDASGTGPAIGSGLTAADDVIGTASDAAFGSVGLEPRQPQSAESAPSLVGNPLPDAGADLRDAAKGVTDMVVLMEQDDPRDMLSHDQGGDEAPGGAAGLPLAEPDLNASAPSGVRTDLLPADEEPGRTLAGVTGVDTAPEAGSPVHSAASADAGAAAEELPEPADAAGTVRSALPNTAEALGDGVDAVAAEPLVTVDREAVAGVTGGTPLEEPVDSALTEGISLQHGA